MKPGIANEHQALPQRIPFVGPPVAYSGAPAETVEQFADAVREWATAPESSRCRGVMSPGIGIHQQPDQDKGVTHMTIDAIGYLRRDVSGVRQQWDETQLRSLAKRLGYNLRKTIVFGPGTDAPEHRLRVVVSGLGVDAVIVPSVDHFDGAEIPAELVAVADVITVMPAATYARWSTGKLPELDRPELH